MSYPCAKAAAFALNMGSGWKNLNVLDITAGSGAWGIAFAESDSGTKVTAPDLPNVLEVTKKMVSKFDPGERVIFIPGVACAFFSNSKVQPLSTRIKYCKSYYTLFRIELWYHHQ